MSGQCSQVGGLDRPTESSPQFVGPGFDEGVMSNAHDGAVEPFQGHRDAGGLLKQLIQLFLKPRHRFIHESASYWAGLGPQSPKWPHSTRKSPGSPINVLQPPIEAAKVDVQLERNPENSLS